MSMTHLNIPHPALILWGPKRIGALNHLPFEKKVQVINGLCNGLSLRGCSRLFGVHRRTISRLLVRVGDRCDDLLREKMRNLRLEHVEIDEVWTFCGKKEARLSPREQLDHRLGSQYLFFGMDRDTKVIPAWTLGKRDQLTAVKFLYRLQNSMGGEFSTFSTDGWLGYKETIGSIFSEDDVAWGVTMKQYYSPLEEDSDHKYGPPRAKSVWKRPELGDPDLEKISTSMVECANRTVRTFQCRFHRLTCAFSRKLENLKAACALHFGYYNFCWQHRSLKGLTPAMAAGVTNSIWEVAQLVEGC